MYFEKTLYIVSVKYRFRWEWTKKTDYNNAKISLRNVYKDAV